VTSSSIYLFGYIRISGYWTQNIREINKMNITEAANTSLLSPPEKIFTFSLKIQFFLKKKINQLIRPQNYFAKISCMYRSFGIL